MRSPPSPASLAASVRSGEPGCADDACARDQPRAARHPGPLPGGDRLRRGRRPQGRRLRRHPRTARQDQFGAGVRHAARRAVDPRPGARRRGVRAAADPRDPVPRLLAQRRGPDPRRRRDAAVLLQPAVPQPDGRAGRRATATRRASAGTSTTTTRSPRCATSPASSSRRRRVPTTPRAMLHTCAAAAKAAGAVCVFLEPIALYHTRDLHDDGDDGWLAPYPRRRACRSAGPAPTATART